MKDKFSHTNFIISPLNSGNAQQLHEFMVSNAERLRRYFPRTLASNLTVEDSGQYISDKNAEIGQRTNFTFAISDSKTQAIAGLVILKELDWTKGQGELAYCIGAAFENKGLTSYAVKKMTQFAFDGLRLETLQIISHKTNLGSIKVAEKNGFTWQKTLPDEFTPTNEPPLDMELYELTNER